MSVTVMELGLVGQTICIPHPRPAPARIWKPIHVPVEEEVVSVDNNPLPIATNTPAVTAQGR